MLHGANLALRNNRGRKYTDVQILRGLIRHLILAPSHSGSTMLPTTAMDGPAGRDLWDVDHARIRLLWDFTDLFP